MLLALLATLTPSLHAFAPSEEVYIGVEPARTLRFHPAAQARLRADADWVEFVAGEGAGWQARFDERTGTAHRAWGPGIALGSLQSDTDVERALRRLFARYPGLVGSASQDLKLTSAGHVARTDTWYVDFQRYVDGIPVWRGGVTARIKNGNLVLLGVDTHPQATEAGPVAYSADEAVALAISDGPVPDAEHTDAKASQVVLPLERDGRLRYHRAWQVRTRTQSPPGIWVSFVDAATGELLNVHNEVRFLDGTLSGVHDTRTVDGSTSTSAMRELYIRGDSSGTNVATGSDGSFTLADTESWTAQLKGSYLTVRNEAGAEGSLVVSGPTATWTEDAATQAEIDTWVFLHQVRDWGLLIAPEVAMSTEALRSSVNMDSNCNAYYDGSVNFYEAGGGCNNTGRIADVNYHEWGHGFHYYSLEAGTWDGTVGEGAGDVVSALNTLDPVIAPYFMTTGSGIREIASDMVYPDDVYGEVHQDGLIFAGAVWDLLGVLAAERGESTSVKGQAWTITSTLFADALKGGPTLETAYDEFVVADDDDGDLGNGTPHTCAILEAFARHGLGPAGGTSLVGLDHVPLDNQEAGMVVPLDGAIANLAPTCVELDVDRVDAYWSTDGGETWQSTPLPVAGEDFAGELPAFDAGTVVQYYLSAESADGTSVSAPAGGAWAPYTFYVGGLEPIWCEDFSEDDGGFVHELIEGSGEGADDWQFGAPNGLEGDPSVAWTGEDVWGNDLGGGRYNGAYQPNVVNRLLSPEIDLAGASAVVVQYRRWLNVEDGYYDQARVYANDVEVWANHESGRNEGDQHTEDGDWVLHTLEVAPDAGTLQLAWELQTDQGLELGGWNVDDVCVYAAYDASTWFAVADFDASDDRVGEVEVRWTQPSDERATKAVVVRRTDRFPENREDGDVVYQSDNVEPGAEMSVVDDVEGDVYYAVFAGGAEGWLVGAREGFNADAGKGLAGDGSGGPGEGGIKVENEGCGCASGGAPAGSLAAVALGALALVRRRRSAR